MLKKYILLFFTFTTIGQNLLSDAAQVSILTVGTAPFSYAMYGHTAIRIKDDTNKIDNVYNFGAFDFATENFILKFVKGDLQYFIGVDNYVDFEYNYQTENRSITEQRIKLTTVQTNALYQHLEQSLTSDDKFYTYKFIDKNCTSIVVQKLEKTIGKKVFVPSNKDQTYREILYPYMTDFWMKLGIQIIFGKKVDEKVATVFLPIEFENAIDKSNYLAQKNRVFEAKNAPEFSFFNSIYCLIAIVVVLILLNKKSIKITYFFIAGFLGIFFSVVGLYSLHEEVLWNHHIVLFNPFFVLLGYYMIKNNSEKIKLWSKIILAFQFLFIIYTLKQVHFGILVPIIVLHLYWLIQLGIKKTNSKPY